MCKFLHAYRRRKLLVGALASFECACVKRARDVKRKIERERARDREGGKEKKGERERERDGEKAKNLSLQTGHKF